MPKPRYLTKSRYKTAQECPTKLFYGDRNQEYENSKIDNPFLEALAEGGFQVGALAQIYYPGGVEIKAKDHDQAVKETGELLQNENATIFEAAFRYNNLFIRADIVVKTGNIVRLLEVKAKTIDPDNESFYNQTVLKSGIKKLVEKWKPYLYDVAFQTYVCQRAKPDLTFVPYLMLTDRTKLATVEGLNQRFFLFEDNGRTRVEVEPGTELETVGEKILSEVNVQEEVALIHLGQDLGEKSRRDLGLPSFEEEIKNFSELYANDQKAAPKVSSECKRCEFRTHSQEKKNGFSECWATVLPKDKLNGPFVFDVWYFNRTEDLLAEKRYLISEITESDIEPKEDPKKPGLTRSQRQWIQVEKVHQKSNTPFVDVEGLKARMSSWKFPLHFIDFETCTPALPFNQGRRPYETIAFQFSHHNLQKGGKIEHFGEYINFEKGRFPNFDFVRALKHSLGDEGTIFRYSNHENTVLCHIYEQLKSSKEADRDELMNWIKTLTKSTGSKSKKKSEDGNTWEGPRNMVDLCEVVISHYYHPFTNGSNSIKKVLPAILKESDYLKTKYQRPIYGTRGGIQSKNFHDKVWLKYDEQGEIVDPYSQLDKLFENVTSEQLDNLVGGAEEIKDGGAAMMAYAKMQFSRISEAQREEYKNALLRYCELDTLAMVMLYEHLVEVTKPQAKKKAA